MYISVVKVIIYRTSIFLNGIERQILNFLHKIYILRTYHFIVK